MHIIIDTNALVRFFTDDDKTKADLVESLLKNEKELLTGIKAYKKDLERLRLEAETAELKAELSKAAEIRYGKIPGIEKELDMKMKKLKKLQSSRRILKEVKEN